MSDNFGPPPHWSDLSATPDPDRPWYRRPVVLIGGGLIAMILIALIGYGILALAGGGPTSVPPVVRPAKTSTTAPAPTPEFSDTAPSHLNTPPAPANQHPGPQLPQVPGLPQLPQIPGLPSVPPLPPLPSKIEIPHGPTLTLPPIFGH